MKKNETIFRGIIYLVLGILLVVGVSGNELIGWLLSISMLVSGAALLIAGVITERSAIGNLGFSGAIMITVGLALLPPIALFGAYFQAISLLMIVIGCLFVLDSLLGFTKKRALLGNLIILAIGAILTTFGFLLWFNVGNMQAYASLIFGIILIIYASLLLLSGFLGKDIIVVVSKK